MNTDINPLPEKATAILLDGLPEDKMEEFVFLSVGYAVKIGDTCEGEMDGIQLKGQLWGWRFENYLIEKTLPVMALIGKGCSFFDEVSAVVDTTEITGQDSKRFVFKLSESYLHAYAHVAGQAQNARFI